jgi:Lon protease-like protein
MEIPLFPLRSVLFPGGPLPLRIFETRYVDMVRRCLRNDEMFGVVLIQDGAETGPVAETTRLGCSARIVDFSQGDDGLLGIVARGERRFELLEQRRQADGLHLGRIAWLAQDPAVAVPPGHEKLAKLLRRALPELGDLYASMPVQLEDAAWLGYRLAEVLPLGLMEKQKLLELEDPLARLTRLEALVRRESR